MRTADRSAVLLAVLIGGLAPVASATSLSELGARLNRFLHQIPGVPGQAQAVTPQAIHPASGPNGASVDLSNLSDPVRLEQRLRRLMRGGQGPLQVTVPNGQARLGDFSVGSSEVVTGHLLVLSGDVDLFGRVNGNVVALDGDIILHPAALVTGDALAMGGRIKDRGGVVQGEQRSLGAAPASEAKAGSLTTGLTRSAGLLGVLFTLGLVGFGVVLFARPNLETISDTVSHSVFRSFLTGLLAQILVIPTFGMLITGLVLSVVGILLVPFVVIVVPFLLLVALVAGFLGVAHAMGETHLRRRMAAGALVGSANSYRYLVLGLSGIAAIWFGWILLGWVPVAGALMFAAAFLATWLLATIGFGAALLSRAGIKPAFAGRYVPAEAVTDEYLWATPQFGVTAAKRPPKTPDSLK